MTLGEKEIFLFILFWLEAQILESYCFDENNGKNVYVHDLRQVT